MYDDDINKLRYETMLQHNHWICIQSEAKHDITIFVVYTNNLTREAVAEAMNKVEPVTKDDEKLSIKFLITQFKDMPPDAADAKKPYHGKFQAHQKIISFDDKEKLTYQIWQKLIVYDPTKKKSDLIYNYITGAETLISLTAYNFCTNLNVFFAPKFIQDKNITTIDLTN